jgi:glycosyltransferase involved in cell wall biosynthesis
LKVISSDTPRGTSVLLPIFFRENSAEAIQLLSRALESVEEQNFPGPHEILIVDDGSPTPIETAAALIGSDELLQNVRFIRVSRNNGLANALNIGLIESCFPFIARIDADDRWLPTKIEKQFLLFDADPDLSITATGMHLVTPAGKPFETHIRPGDWNGILRFFTDVGCPFPHGSILARRDIFHLMGGYSHLPTTAHCKDYALWGHWLRFFKPAMVEEALYDGFVSSLHSEHQCKASGLVNARFQAIKPVERVPSALADLAEATELSVLKAGVLAYNLWRFRLSVVLPKAALGPLDALIPDRLVLRREESDCPVVDLERIVGQHPTWSGASHNLEKYLRVSVI